MQRGNSINAHVNTAIIQQKSVHMSKKLILLMGIGTLFLYVERVITKRSLLVLRKQCLSVSIKTEKCVSV